MFQYEKLNLAHYILWLQFVYIYKTFFIRLNWIIVHSYNYFA